MEQTSILSAKYDCPVALIYITKLLKYVMLSE